MRVADWPAAEKRRLVSWMVGEALTPVRPTS